MFNIYRFCLIVFLLFSGSHSGFTQSISQSHRSGFAIDISSGISSGWWLYNRGSTNPDILNDQGWDRTSNSPFWHNSISLLYRFQQLSLGVTLQYDLFLEDKMRAFDDRDAVYARYPIAENAVPFRKYGLQLEFTLLQKRRYTLSPMLQFGSFQLETDHPQSENFSGELFWVIGLTNEISWRQLSFIIRPRFSSFHMNHKETVLRNEGHQIYNFGLALGIRWWPFSTKEGVR